MSSFRIAIVQFSPSGRAYPVNCCWPFIGSGDRVIVRLERQSKRLQAAEVLEIASSRRPCTNSIVCLESGAEGYGDGPAGVETLQDLQLFLKRSGWTYFETISIDSGSPERAAEWPAAYVEHGIVRLEKYLSPPLRRIHIGSVHISPVIGNAVNASARVGRSVSSSDIISDKLVDGKLLMSRDFIFEFKWENAENAYRRAAEWAEGDLSLDEDPPADRSLAQIYDAISDGKGGPSYLSDDVWLR